MKWRKGYLFLAIFLMGCHSKESSETPSPKAVVASVSKVTITLDDISTVIATPENCTEKEPCQAVIFLGGMSGGTVVDEVSSGVADAARDSGTILVVPGGPANAWQIAVKDSEQDRELGFFSHLIAELPKYHVNPDRIHLLGFGDGASMSYLVAASLSPKVASVCGVGGTIAGLNSDWSFHMIPTPTSQLSVMMVHGVADTEVGFGMSTFTLDVPTEIEWWAGQMTPQTKEIDTTSSDGAVQERMWQAKNGQEVWLRAFTKMGHEWPSSLKTPSGAQANGLIFQFFARHQLKQT